MVVNLMAESIGTIIELMLFFLRAAEPAILDNATEMICTLLTSAKFNVSD
jgi:hypothetical protein